VSLNTGGLAYPSPRVSMKRSASGEPTAMMADAAAAAAPDVAVPDAVENDYRLNVDDLLAEHKDNIDALRAELGDELLATPDTVAHDELWLLRYLLSNTTVALSASQARKALAWRMAHVPLLDAAKAGADVLPGCEAMKKVCAPGARGAPRTLLCSWY